MNKVQIKLTVLFDGTFWVGIFKKIVNNKLEVAKFTFGSEPKDIEIHNFILNNYRFLKFSPPVKTIVKNYNKINPKRLQRSVKNQLKKSVGTKSQQALKQQHELIKQDNKENYKIKREQAEKKKFEIKQKKKLEKHKGR